METKTVLIKQRLANEPIVAELKMTKEIGRIIVTLKMKAFQYEKKCEYSRAYEKQE